MVKNTSIPLGVKIISILYYIGAVFGVIFGLLFLVGAGMVGSFANQIPIIGAIGAGLFILVGIVLICLGVLSFFVGRGLWKGSPWARIVAIVFAVLGVLMGISSMVSGSIASNLFGVVLHLIIGGYLLFSKDVKKAFV